MQQVQEDDLQQLDMFTEYAQLLTQHIEGKPFQKLLFLLRDWPHSKETGYGYRPEIIEKLLESKDTQTPDMHALRERIRSSFGVIDAFLLPHPGLRVSDGNFENLTDIEHNFIEYV